MQTSNYSLAKQAYAEQGVDLPILDELDGTSREIHGGAYPALPRREPNLFLSGWM